MIRFRGVVLGALVGVLGADSAEPFVWDSRPDMVRLAEACAPVAGKPAPSLPLLMDALVPLEGIMAGMMAGLDTIDLIRWHERFYRRLEHRLDPLPVTGLSRWYSAPGAGALLTVEGNYELVQRDLASLKEIRRVPLDERVLGIAATAFPTLVLLFTIPDISYSSPGSVWAFDLTTGTLTELPLAYLESWINPARDLVANRTHQYRITLEDPKTWEKTPKTADPGVWQVMETADQSRIPKALPFPYYRAWETQWTREAVAVPPAIREFTYQKTLLGALRNLADVDPDALPPGNVPAVEILSLGYDDAPGVELQQRRKDLDEEMQGFVRNYLANSRKHLLVARDSGDYYLLTQSSGGTNYQQFLHRITEGKPILSWRGDFRGDAPGFIGTSPDGRYFLFGSIRLAGDPWLHVVRAEDLQEFTLSDQPLGWGPEGGQVAFDPKGARLAAATPDGSIWIYDIDTAKARLTLADRIQALPHGPAGRDADTITRSAAFDHLSWIDGDTLLFDIAEEYVQALSLRTRLPLWTLAHVDLGGSIALPERGLAVVWTSTQALVLEGRSGLPLGAPLEITVRELEADFLPRFAAEITPDGQLRVRAGHESWLRKLPRADAMTNEAAQALLARYAGLTVSGGEVVRLTGLPKEMAVKK